MTKIILMFYSSLTEANEAAKDLAKKTKKLYVIGEKTLFYVEEFTMLEATNDPSPVSS